MKQRSFVWTHAGDQEGKETVVTCYVQDGVEMVQVAGGWARRYEQDQIEDLEEALYEYMDNMAERAARHGMLIPAHVAERFYREKTSIALLKGELE